MLCCLLAAVLVAAGCGGEDGEDRSGDDLEGTAFGAAELRGELATRLNAHVYLSGATMIVEAERGPDSAAAVGARMALDRNTVELGETIGSAYGTDVRDQFVEEWRGLALDQLSHTEARLAGADRDATGALEAIDDDRRSIGELLAAENENFTAKGLARELQPSTELLTGVADQLADGGPVPIERLRRAALATAGAGEVIATAIGTQLPNEFPGDADSPASALRAELSTALQSHVYLTGLELAEISAAGQRSSRARRAGAAVDRNSEAIRSQIGAAYGQPTASRFLAGWDAHRRQLLAYYAARASGDAEAATRAGEELADYRGELARLLARGLPDLSVEEASAAIAAYLDSMLASIDMIAASTGSSEDAAAASDAIEALRETAMATVDLGATVSDAVARTKSKFSARAS